MLKFLLLMSLFFGCAQFKADKFINGLSSKRSCEADAIYAMGFNAGKSNKDMSTNPARGCDVLDKAMLTKKYQQGFRDGIKNAPKGSTTIFAGGLSLIHI